jgi:hypothetical protein
VAKRFSLALISVALVALFAIGCGSTDNNKPATSASPTARTAQSESNDAVARDREAKERDKEVVALRDEWVAIIDQAAPKAPSWADQVRGVSKDAVGVCAAAGKWSGINSLFVRASQKPDLAKMAGIDWTKLKAQLVSATKDYLSNLGASLGKAVPCGSGKEGDVETFFTDGDVEVLIRAMEGDNITPTDVGMTIAQLRNLHLSYAKRGLSDIVASYRRCSTDAQGNLWGYLHDWHYTPEQLGLKKAEADKILNNGEIEGCVGGEEKK